MRLNFPKDFLWGASTSAHQTEGGNRNDWSEWEKVNAIRLKKRDGNKYTISNYISGKACDHYHLFEEDFKIAKRLKLNAYRFSIEWSRIQPTEDKVNYDQLEHYKKVIEGLKKKNIQPFITLWHWTIPIWLQEKGGWSNKIAIEHFSRFAEKIITTFPTVKYWITLNEPEVYATQSYLLGIWPPQKRNFYSFCKVIKHLIKAHQKIYVMVKKINRELQVGIAKNNIYFEADRNSLINNALKKIADYFWNFYFLNRIKETQDFIGLNYYFHSKINYGFGKNENRIVSDLGWELYPEGIYFVLKDLVRYQKPIYITENGLADSKDRYRAWYIKEILKNVSKAISEGVDVRGYFHWSLLDNFEWDKGFWPRFGLAEVDYKTLKRKIRPSALIYSKIIQKTATRKNKNQI